MSEVISSLFYFINNSCREPIFFVSFFFSFILSVQFRFFALSSQCCRARVMMDHLSPALDGPVIVDFVDAIRV